jgi:hypothetical protein
VLPAPVKLDELSPHLLGEIIWGDPAGDRYRGADLSQVLGAVWR